MHQNKFSKDTKNVKNPKEGPKPLSQREIEVRFVESHCHICQHTVTSRIDLVPDHCLRCGRTDWLSNQLSKCCEMCDYYNNQAMETDHEEQYLS